MDKGDFQLKVSLIHLTISLSRKSNLRAKSLSECCSSSLSAIVQTYGLPRFQSIKRIQPSYSSVSEYKLLRNFGLFHTNVCKKNSSGQKV